jgi:Tfp pilus assembly protein PilF
MGDQAAALQNLQKMLLARESLLANRGDKLADCYNHMGVILHRQGDYDGAVEKYQQAMDISNNLDEPYEEMIRNRRNLANSVALQKRNVQAEEIV